jgi:hypothetical protein
MFSGTLSLTQENHHFIVQIGKNKCSQWTKLPRICITSYYTAHNNWFSRNSNILKFLLSPVRFTKCLGVRVPQCPPRKKALVILFKTSKKNIIMCPPEYYILNIYDIVKINQIMGMEVH